MRNKSNGRDVTTPSLAPLSRSMTFDSMVLQPVKLNIGIAPDVHLNPIDDRRTYDPTRSSRNISPQNRNASRIKPARGAANLTSVRFNLPGEVPVCARRNQRREVLHALRLTRRRGKSGGKPRRNFWSKVSCK